MEIKESCQRMDALVKQGQMANAVREFFAENALTSDYNGQTTASRDEMVAKMNGFVDAIARVNGIEYHGCLIDGDRSASEFTFDFGMKDGSRILWHEIILRRWQNGRVVHESYFDAQQPV